MQVRLRVENPERKPQVMLFEAGSPAEAIRQAGARGIRVLGIESAGAAEPSALSQGRQAFPLLMFSQELLALLEAGLNLNEALEALHAKEARPAAKAVLAEVLAALRRGRSFSDALAEYPQQFPELYVATVKAAERTGDLPNALLRYIAYQLQIEALRKKLVSAAIYPVMLLCVGGAVLFFLLGYVVPKFSMVYDSSGRELPWLSELLLSFGRAIRSHWPWILGTVALAVGGLVYGLMQPALRRRLGEAVLGVPLLRRKAEEFRFARFYRALGLLLAAGIPLIRAMGMAENLLLSGQRRRLASARVMVEQGQALSAALVQQGLASPVAESLLRVGERSGRLGDMLEHTARFHDEDFARWVDWASRLLEPMLMTVMGLVIGIVVVLMYIPIFELAGSMQ
jgi:general secretion pathway protein F